MAQLFLVSCCKAAAVSQTNACPHVLEVTTVFSGVHARSIALRPGTG